MDDNTVNPETPNENSNEFEEFLKNSEEVPAEEPAAEPLPEEDSDKTADTEEPAVPEEASAQEPETGKKKKKKKGAGALIAVLIAIMIAATGFMVYVLVKSGSAPFDLEKTVITVGDVENSAAEYYQVYSYYYAYNSYYYQYPEEQLKDLAKDQLVFIDTLYSEALAAGYTMTEEDNQSIEENLNGVVQEAEAMSQSIDEYLEQNVCKGYTMDMLRSYMEKQYLAQKYYTDCMEKLEGEMTDDQIAEEYAANKASYDLSDLAYWYISASDDGAQDQADQIIDAVKGGKTLNEAIQSVTGDSEKTANLLKGYTQSVISENFSSEAAEWAFTLNDDGSYANGKGAVMSFEANGMIYILYVNEVPGRDESVPATVEYIEVDISSDTSVKTEEELKLSAKSTASKILDEFNATDKSVEAFDAIIQDYNNGSDQLVSGDIFEDITKDGSHDAAVEEWAFDASRKAGDCTLVEGDGCYYVLYYVEKGESPVWYSAVQEALVAAKQTEWQDNIDKLSEGKVVTDDAAIDEIIAYVKSTAQNAQAQ